MLKGYHSWAGRALVGLQALESCIDLLSGYTIAVYSVSPAVAKAGKRFEKMTGIRTKIIPKGTPHAEILGLHGSARLSIGLSVSDGLSTSFLEAMAMGSFPIQSWTACADEWIEDGKTGLLVPPEDPLAVAQAIRHALTDDEMVDHAAEKNYRTVEMRLDHALLKHKATELYAAFAKDRGIRNEA
jgi:glycosyltransferase involved in cell wall biosynthesis